MELYLILGVIGIQLYIFIIAVNKITVYRNSLPAANSVNVQSEEEFLDEEDEDSPIFIKHQIHSTFRSVAFNSIRSAINKYLDVNKGATADMSLLKSVVDRNVLKLENEISALTPLPLYFGLLGTMGGIVIGLFQIPSVGSSSFVEGEGIDVLIGGVKYAMIASLIGVLFTSILSGWIYRSAKYAIESRTNDLLTFLETELLPILKEDVSANLYNLYQNLAQFNHRFTNGVDKLQDVMQKNHQAILSQVNLIEELKRIDIIELAGANVEVFKEMKKLMPEFRMLAKYVKGINESFDKSEQLTGRITEVLDKTSEVKSLVEFLQGSTNQAISLNQIVEKHFELIGERNQQFVIATNGMEDKAKISIEHFKAYVIEQIESLKEMTRKEENLMIKAFEKNRGVLEKLNELSDIKLLLNKIDLNSSKIQNYDFSNMEGLVKNINHTLRKNGLISKSKSKGEFKDRRFDGARKLLNSLKSIFIKNK